MKLSSRKDIDDGWRWRCSKCSKSIGLRVGTFFEKFSRGLILILKLLIHWALQTRQYDQTRLLEVTKPVIRHIQQKIGLLISLAFQKND